MKSDKVLVFDLSGEYGHFRKFNTTTSPLTYPMPPLPALAGIFGAVLGIERETSPGVFPSGVVPLNELFSPEKMSVAIQMLNPVKKTRMAFNLLDTEKVAQSFFNIKNRTQIEFELLKEPAFRIFFQHSDEQIFQTLAKRIKAKQYHFTPYLGLSQFAALLEYRDVLPCIEKQAANEPVEVMTGVNISNLDNQEPVKFRKGVHYSLDTYPHTMLPNREIIAYAEILTELKQGEKARFWVNTPHFWQAGTLGNIIFI